MTSSVQLAAFQTRCPMCGAQIAGRCEIEWDSEKTRYNVKLSTFCGGCAYEEQPAAVLIKIAELSQCACGSQLRLGNHKIIKTGDGELAVEATYTCTVCPERKQTVWNFLKEFLLSAWKSTKKIEISDKGVVFEKD